MSCVHTGIQVPVEGDWVQMQDICEAAGELRVDVLEAFIGGNREVAVRISLQSTRTEGRELHRTSGRELSRGRGGADPDISATHCRPRAD